MLMKQSVVSLAFTFILCGISWADDSKARKPDKKSSPFQVAPAKIFPLLERLQRSSGKEFKLSPDEVKLIADAEDGRLDNHTFGEACLIASGVTDAGKRKRYLEQLAELEKQAIQQLDDARTVFDKGEKLLNLLHAGPMKKGYSSKQTLLHSIFDEGKFNCVSSAVLYNVIGRRVGLDLRAIEIPEHVLSVLYDGDKQADIETTNKLGFNPARDPATAKKLEKPGGGTIYVPERHAKLRREVGELGLAAIIYYNRGVELEREKRFHEAILVNFSALSLDEANATAAKNALAGFINWGLALEKEGCYEESLNVVEIGLEIAPNDSTLKNNYKVVWHHYADGLMKKSQVDDALAVLRRAAQKIPTEEFIMAEADLFIHEGEVLVKANQFDAARSLATDGLKKLGHAKPQQRLREWKVGLFLRQANDKMNAGEYESALTVLKKGADVEPENKHIRNNQLATYDTWASTFMKKNNWDGAIKIYRTALEQFPGEKHILQNIRYCEQEMKKSK